MRTFPENIDPDLLIAFICNETSPEESELVKEWMASSYENKARFEDLKYIWNATASAFPQPAEVDTDKAWQKLSGRIEKYESEKLKVLQVKDPPTLFLRYALRAAAVLIPLVVAGYFLISYYSKPEMLSFSTSNLKSEKTLSDGTSITLNHNSQLQYSEEFNDNSREVSLLGEAFFKVSPNPEKPFIIHAGSVDVKVVGTAFNVNNYPDSSLIEVFVEEGKVMLYTVNLQGVKTDSLLLEAGDAGIFDKKTNRLSKSSQVKGSELFWMNKTLIFNKTRLEEVFKLIEEKYDVQITITDPEINNLHLTTRFVDQPIDDVMKVIAESFHLKYSRNQSTIEINAPEN